VGRSAVRALAVSRACRAPPADVAGRVAGLLLLYVLVLIPFAPSIRAASCWKL